LRQSPSDRPRAWHATTAAIAIAWLVSASPVAAQQNPFNADGFPAARGTYGSFPYEKVDPLSGNLIVSVTDLALPGPLSLTVSRTYNSKFHTDFEHGNQNIEEVSPLGVGWRLHFGRVLHAAETTPGRTVVETPDGAGGALYQTSAYPEGWISKGFLRYDRSNHTAKVPNGVIYTFGHIGEASGPRGQVRYVTAITDQYGNSITFQYNGAAGRVTRAHQVLNAGQWRDVDFTYGGPGGRLSAISYAGRTWAFAYDPAPGAPGDYVLRFVTPPAGLRWEYTYNNTGAGPELTSLIAPGGGRVDYTYDTVARRSGALSQSSRVVRQRLVYGRAIPTAGTWTFSYNQGPDQDTTVVECPCGTTSYAYHGIGTSTSGNFAAWATGLLKQRKVLQGTTVLEQEDIYYGTSEPISSNAIPGEGGQWSDPAVYLALTLDRSLTRGGQTWTTHYVYNPGSYNDFGRPYRVEEQGPFGELFRISEVGFQYGFTPWIIGGTAWTTVRASSDVGVETVQTSSTAYELSTGFVTTATSMGVPTTFTRNANGTVATSTNANGHTTTFLYNWGVVSDIRGPILWSAKGINPDGSTASELVGNDPNPANNALTTYEYDDGGRLRYVRPRDSNFTRYTYDDGIGYTFVQVDRGAATTTTALDGFGRAVSTLDSTGVKTRIDRDACGRVTYASGAYTAGDGSGRGTTTEYDEMGRVKKVTVTDPAGTAYTQYEYLGTDVRITDAIGRQTFYDYKTFAPGDGRVVGVTDADGKTTSYQYDTLGNLRRVDGPGPGVPPRTWTYNGVRLTSDTQPESGQTTYTYDPLGNLKTVTDSLGRITTLNYDLQERLTNRDAPGTSSDVTLGYDAVGRLWKKVIGNPSNADVTTTFTFDTAQRTISRKDDITGGLSYTSNYSYDGNDNLTQIRYPCTGTGCANPRDVTYEYDPLNNRLTTVRNRGAIFASGFTYDGAGRLASYVTGTVTHQFDYDVRDRVSRLRAGPTSGNALDLTYSYNKVSQVLGITDGRGPGWGQSFGYDALDRLIGAAGPWGLISWTYDAQGNRQTENRGASTVYNYDAKNRLTSTTGANPEGPFGYNAVGELTDDSQGHYDYTPAGMLLAATRPGMTASYLYDADLLRVKRTVNNTTVLTIRGAGGQVLTEMQSPCAGSPQWVRDNIYAGGKLLGAVRNNTPATRVEFEGPGTGIDEGFGSFGMAVRIYTGNGQPLACPVTVSFEFTAGTATPTLDYTGTNGTLTFAAGTASGSYLGIYSTFVNDSLDEDDEYYKVRLTGAVGAVLGATSEHTVTIYDNDPAPSLTINDVTVNENSGPAVFTVSLSAASAKTITIAYTTVANGTALAGSDFTTTAGTLTFLPGQTTATISVPIINDNMPEPNETFTVSLSSPSNATIADGTGVGTIVSDEKQIDPSLPGQYFADVESSGAEAGYLRMFNPHTVAVVARLTYVWADGHAVNQDFSIPAQQRQDVGLVYQPGIGGTGRFSVAVQSLDASRPLVAEHVGYSPADTFTGGRADGGSTPAPTWYFGEGSANSFFEETVSIFNPGNSPVQVTITLVKDNGTTAVLTPLIPSGPGRVELRVNDWATGDHGLIVSGTIQGTSTPANIAVQRTERWPLGGVHETSTTSGASSLTNNWYFGDGGKGAWSTFLAFMNPSTTQTAEAYVFYVHDNGQTYGQPVSVPPMRRVTVSPPPTMPDGGFAIQVGSSNLVNYAVERSMYSGPAFALGSASTPAPLPALTWRFAEGSSNPYFDSYFLVFNVNYTTAANVTMTFRKTTGGVATKTLTLPPRTRIAVNADVVPGIDDNADYSTEVTSTNSVYIVVERSTYWPHAGWNGSHSSMGRPQ